MNESSVSCANGVSMDTKQRGYIAIRAQEYNKTKITGITRELSITTMCKGFATESPTIPVTRPCQCCPFDRKHAAIPAHHRMCSAKAPNPTEMYERRRCGHRTCNKGGDNVTKSRERKINLGSFLQTLARSTSFTLFGNRKRNDIKMNQKNKNFHGKT